MNTPKEKPILFSTDMVRAILNGSKSQTRRVCKIPNGDHFGTDIMDWALSKHPWLDTDSNKWVYRIQTAVDDFRTIELKCPYEVGMVLWVRETWQQECEWIKFKDADWADAYLNATGKYVYKADGVSLEGIKHSSFGKWKPSIFMPREACRIKLLIKSIRVERLQDISEEDAKAEGIEKHIKYNSYKNYIDDGWVIGASYSYQTLWGSINGPGSWQANPYVWCLTFEKL